MKFFKFIIALIFMLSVTVLLCTGCKTIPKDNARAQVRASQQSLSLIMKTFITLRKAGKIDDHTKAKFMAIAELANENLKLWEKAVIAGRKAPDLQEAIILSFNKLIKINKLE